MLFISKTVRDRGILGKFWTPRVLTTTPLAPLKNLDFSVFRPTSRMLVEIENVFHLKTVRDRAILGTFWTPRVLGTTPLAPLKNLDFSDFRPPS